MTCERSITRSRTVGFAAIAAMFMAIVSPGAIAAGAGADTVRIAVNPALAGEMRPGPKAHEMRDLRAAFAALRDSARGSTQPARFELLLNAGLYRLREPLVWVPPEDTRPVTVVVRARDRGRVVICGAETGRRGDPAQPWSDWRAWTAIDSARRIYATEWPYAWGLAPIEDYSRNYRDWMRGVDRPEFLRRREMVLVNGTHLRQALARDELTPGSFCVEPGGEAGPGRLFVRLSSPPGPADSVEIPVARALLILRRFDRVELEGIVFRHANPFHPGSAVEISGTESVRIERCDFLENNWRGLSLGHCPPLPVDRSRPDSLEVIDCRANGNGAVGMGFGRVARLRLENCETSFNNWRGDAAGTRRWAVTAVKLIHAHDVTVTGHVSRDNLAPGFWVDTDGARVRIEGAVLTGNATRGLFVEASQGPVDVVACTIRDNGGAGVQLNGSDNVTVRDCRIEDNGGGQVLLAGIRRSFRDFERPGGGTVRSSCANTVFAGNMLIGKPLFATSRWVSARERDRWLERTVFRGNRCDPPDPSSPFCR